MQIMMPLEGDAVVLLLVLEVGGDYCCIGRLLLKLEEVFCKRISSDFHRRAAAQLRLLRARALYSRGLEHFTSRLTNSQ